MGQIPAKLSANNSGDGKYWSYKRVNSHEVAMKMYTKALDIQLELLERRRVDTADSYNNIGVILNHQEKYDEALKSNQKDT